MLFAHNYPLVLWDSSIATTIHLMRFLRNFFESFENISSAEYKYDSEESLEYTKTKRGSGKHSTLMVTVKDAVLVIVEMEYLQKMREYEQKDSYCR